ACAKAGASMVHLHVRDLTGEQTFDMTQFSRTLDLIREQSDIVIQGSTGGLSTLSLEDRSVCLSEPRVEVASLNMGSVNFGESVYINTLPEIRYWAGRMREEKVVPEMEIFDLSMVETCSKLADEGVLDRPMSYNFCLGTGTASNLSDTPRNLQFMTALMEPDGHWGLNNDSMKDLHFLGLAIAMGASVVRVGFEDSFYYEEGKTAPTNAFLVEKLVKLVRALGCEPATPEEAREILGIKKLRG
ncbi:MAG: 3-keto-5-aminohexanoate cleavage protein, partial [Alistipes sp.]|nr:3-keto-5-aminohexanoate cleavage protein [Alistipes sp.]